MKWWNNQYPDNKTLLVALPLMTLFITLVGTDHELIGLFQQRIVYQKLIFNYLFIVGIWFLVRLIIRLGDQYWPWNQFTWKRGLIQILATLFVCSILIYIMLDFRQLIIPEWQLSPNTFLTIDIPIAILYILVMNYLYYYWNDSNFIKASIPKILSSNSATDIIEIKVGKKVTLLNTDQVAFAYLNGGINFIRTFGNVNHVLGTNLKSLESTLNQNNFYRLNRKLLINKNAVKSFRILPSRKIEVELIPEYLGERLLNKNRAASFKRWLHK